jgi:HSP20 family protein
MNVRDLIPWSRRNATTPTAYGNEQNPLLAFHRDMNRLFDETFRDFGMPSMFGRSVAWPSVEVSETEKDIRVSAELPGLDEKDVEVLLDDGTLTLRGEKKSEFEDKDRHFSERTYGRFERQIPLGFDIEADKVEATFRNGVLTVTIPKSETSGAQTKRIAINTGNSAQ